MRIMSKRKSKRPSSRTSTGAKTGKGMDFFPPLPADDPIFKQGWIVGQTFSGASPKDTQRQNHGAAPRSTARQPTEEEIQAELKAAEGRRLRDGADKLRGGGTAPD